MNDVCEHGSLLLPPGTPWPAGAWTPYCRACWKAGRIASPDRLPPRRVRIDPARLVAEPDTGRAFNPSLTRHRDRWLMAYRTGWAGSRIAVCEVDVTTGVVGPSEVLDLAHPRAGVGAEDPRLFVWRGQLHVAFTAYDGVRTHQLYASVSDSLRVERLFEPRYPMRAAWEKNWQFFEGTDGGLYCVYSIDPHIVLLVDGERVEHAGQTECPVRWDGGLLRGGCPPVLVDGEYWHWFHGAKEEGEPNRRYSVGLYTFEAEPPFRVRRAMTTPVAWASERDFAESGNYCRVAFPGGAVLDRGRWHVAVGVHDRWCEIWSWDHADVRTALGLPKFRGYCHHLGKRTENRPGCSGWSCQWECDAGEPVAIPGGVCQTCPKWEPR